LKKRTNQRANAGCNVPVATPKQRQRYEQTRSNPGQTTTITISCPPNMAAFQSLASSFVLYGLSYGYEPASAATAFAGIMQLLIAAMSNFSAVPEKAPRIWWALTNALRPKNAVHMGITYRFEWDLSSFTVPNQPNFAGIYFGAPITGTLFNGFPTISSASLPSLTAMEATDIVSDLFSKYPREHAVISRVDDYLQDPSIFAWRSLVLPAINQQDGTNSSYGINQLEVPIRSYFGYMGLALGTNTDSGTTGIQRIPTGANFSQGNAGNNLGIRLCFPKYQGAAYSKMKLNLKVVDLESWYFQDVQARIAANTGLLNAERSTAATTKLPAVYDNVSDNLAIIYRLFNYISSMLSFCPCWAQASQTFLAVSVGTNLIDPFGTHGMTDSFISVATARQLQPTYNKRNDSLTVPYPSVSDQFIQDYNSMFEGFYPSTNPDIQFGGDNLDLLNSVVGTTPICWGSPVLKDFKQLVKTADGYLINQIPNSSPLSVWASATISNVLTQKIVNSSSDSEVAVLKRIATFRGLNAEKFVQNLIKRRNAARQVKIDSMDTFTNSDGLEVVESGKKKAVQELAKDGFPVRITKAPGLQSPSTLNAQINAVVGEHDFGLNAVVQNMMQVPIAQYPTIDVARTIHGSSSSYESGMTGSQSLTMEEFGTANSFVKDPTSMQGSEATQEVLKLSKEVLGMAGMGQQFESVISAAAPIAGLVYRGVKAVIPVFKKMVDNGRKRRAARKAKKNQS